MYQLIIIVHVLLGLGVVGLILMQQGKGADAGAAFAGGSGSVFGAQGAASFLSRTTAILAALFFTTSLGLAVLSGYENKPDDLMEQPEIEQPLADVPLIGDSQPATDSIPAITSAKDTPVITAPVKEISVPAETVTNEIPQVVEPIAPIVEQVEETAPVVESVETTDMTDTVESIPATETIQP